MDDRMYGLTLHRPWSWAMAEGIKLVENRDWTPPKRMIGRDFALHAGQRWDVGAEVTLRELLGPFEPQLPSADQVVASAVVAVVRLRCVVLDRDAAEHYAGVGQGRFFFGRFGWVVDERRQLAQPVPCRGYQRLWRLPIDVEAAVREQLGEASA